MTATGFTCHRAGLSNADRLRRDQSALLAGPGVDPCATVPRRRPSSLRTRGLPGGDAHLGRWPHLMSPACHVHYGPPTGPSAGASSGP